MISDFFSNLSADDFRFQSDTKGRTKPEAVDKFYQRFYGQDSNPIPALWLKFQKEAQENIDMQAAAALRGGAEGIRAGREEYERSIGDSFGVDGLSPALSNAFLAESDPYVMERQGQLAAGVEQGRLGNQLGLAANTTNALAQSYLGDVSLRTQTYLAAKGREQARKGSKAGLLSSLGSAVGTVAGAYFGGAGGAALGGALGGQLGGGGAEYDPSINYTGGFTGSGGSGFYGGYGNDRYSHPAFFG